VLNVFLGLFGTAAFVNQARPILEHSLQSQRLLHGFSLGMLIEMFSRPEFGPTMASRAPAVFFALLYLVATALFLPGVLQGYASTYRLPREDFFRACGRNLWRFIRVMIVAGIVMGVIAGILLGVQVTLVKRAEESTNELLSVYVQLAGLTVILLVMTVLRIWFDLAEVDIVLSDQRAVRKSIGTSFRHTFRSLGRLLATYLLATIVAAVVLLGGIWFWMKFVAPENVVGAFLVSQLTLLLLLIPRFWQRGVAVSYWQQQMMVPVAVTSPIEPQPIAMAVVSDGAPAVPPPPMASPES
jgi:ABC-type nitrate/sulfonate/bicarbonate transport system permease component